MFIQNKDWSKDVGVLIVDDDVNMQRALADVLKIKGFSTFTASGSPAVLKMLSREEILVSLIDLRLNGSKVGGLTLLEEVKKARTDMECIVVTGYASQESAIQAVNLGAFGYFTKPYDMDVLLLAVQRAAEKAITQRALQESEAYNRALIEAIPDQVVCFSKDGVILSIKAPKDYVSTARVDLKDIIGKNVFEIDAKLAPRVLACIQSALATSQTQRLEYEVFREGEKEYREARYVAINDHEVVALIRDITEAKQATLRDRDQMQRLTALRAIDRAISSSLDFHLTLEVILNQLKSYLKIDAVNVWLFDSTTQTLKLEASTGFYTNVLSVSRLRLGQGYVGQAALERKMITIGDLSREEKPFSQLGGFASEGFCSYVAVPLFAKGEVKGVLEIFQHTSLSPSQE